MCIGDSELTELPDFCADALAAEVILVPDVTADIVPHGEATMIRDPEELLETDLREFFEGLESAHTTGWNDCRIAKTTLLADALFCSDTESEVPAAHNGQDASDVSGQGESSGARHARSWSTRLAAQRHAQPSCRMDHPQQAIETKLCSTCDLRMCYTPRVGSHGGRRKASTLPVHVTSAMAFLKAEGLTPIAKLCDNYIKLKEMKEQNRKATVPPRHGAPRGLGDARGSSAPLSLPRVHGACQRRGECAQTRTQTPSSMCSGWRWNR